MTKMNSDQRLELTRIIIGILLFIGVYVFDKIYGISDLGDTNIVVRICITLIYFSLALLFGYNVYIGCIKSIFKGQFFNEMFLMSIASIAAFCINQGPEGLAILLFYELGEFLQDVSLDNSKQSIESLMNIKPEYANMYDSHGFLRIVNPNKVNIGNIILVKPGEKIPLDGVVIDGVSLVDTRSMTGESKPVDVQIDSKVISGTVNIQSTLKIKVTSSFKDSTVAKVLNLLDDAKKSKTKTEKFITKFSNIYTPLVCLASVLLLIVGGLATHDWYSWLFRAVSLLVVSCPCALVISVPLSFYSGIGLCSKYGILVKGSNYLEQMSKAKIFVFDKTGTLTKGNFKVTSVEPKEKADEILYYAAEAEQFSSHPIAQAILQANKRPLTLNYHLTNVDGKGLIAKNCEHVICCGNEKLFDSLNIKIKNNDSLSTIVYVSLDNKYLGSVEISDEIKEDAFEAIAYLNSTNSKTVMLTGDNEVVAKDVANKLNITSYKANLLPQEKVDYVNFLYGIKGKNEALCFFGDGINDAPVIMRADIGIAMGGVGSDAAIEASDVVFMNDNLNDIKLVKTISNKTERILYENIIFILLIKFIVLIICSILPIMWLAVFADVGATIIAVCNSLRINKRMLKK